MIKGYEGTWVQFYYLALLNLLLWLFLMSPIPSHGDLPWQVAKAVYFAFRANSS